MGQVRKSTYVTNVTSLEQLTQLKASPFFSGKITVP